MLYGLARVQDHAILEPRKVFGGNRMAGGLVDALRRRAGVWRARVLRSAPILKMSAAVVLGSLIVSGCAGGDDLTSAEPPSGGVIGGSPGSGASSGGTVGGSPGAGGGQASVLPPSPGGSSPCNADAARAAIGQLPNDATVETARIAANAARVRVVPHNGAATMDFGPDRLTLDLDPSGRISALKCG